MKTFLAAAFCPSPPWGLRGDRPPRGRPVPRDHRGRDQDDGALVFLWRTTAGTFRWTHGADEIVTILRGEVFVTDEDGTRHHLTTGDVPHFQEEAVQTWEVPEELVKSAILKPRSPMTVRLPAAGCGRCGRWSPAEPLCVPFAAPLSPAALRVTFCNAAPSPARS